MKGLLSLVLISLVLQLSVAPPVSQKKKKNDNDHENEVEEKEAFSEDIMEYKRYLNEVVQALESDPDFRAKLENVDGMDIKTGRIADELEFVNHKVRTKLDELKREELERLRHLATKENHLKNGLDFEHLKIAEHVDHTNSGTFEIQDLRKLIAKTTKDLAEQDRRRREKFKRYELQREFEEQEKITNMDANEREKYELEKAANREEHKKHEPVHHPGSKQQLKEVWDKQDHMDPENFDLRTFFFLHDLDGNGVWDQDELKALFLKELDKLYAQGAPDEDIMRRTEEMERMREHVFNEADTNKDGLISYDELMEHSRKPDFQQDDGWDPLDEKPVYTEEELTAYVNENHERLQEMRVAGGAQYPNHVPVQPNHGQIPQPEYNPQLPQYQQPHLMDQQYQHGQIPQQQYYPGQVPVQQQLHAGQVPVQQQLHQGQVPVQQQLHQGQVPVQQQLHHGQVPVQQQLHHGQVPAQQQLHPGQVPVQQQLHPGQVPVQQQLHPGQVPVQQQLHQGQVPVEQQHHQGQVPVQQQPPQPQTDQQAAQNAAGVQQNNENHGQHQQHSQSAQVPLKQEINRNNIHAGGKA